ncbi:hypothetical protein JKP88DRAFT_328845 [Tribonema minus]|uniref:Uncharacterized protein n=1 Tax=Tribonema minus TaxID=303371 RepID=A0A836CAP0_9STRA|nr:hypothetical protein JKP88DRAFT_328845 [Tribonema minus]
MAEMSIVEAAAAEGTIPVGLIGQQQHGAAGTAPDPAAAERERAALVAESMAIFRARQADRETPPVVAEVGASPPLHQQQPGTSTAKSEVPRGESPVEWTQELDGALTAAVFARSFDFEAVAVSLRAAASAGNAAAVTANACRLRWAHLDACNDDTYSDDDSVGGMPSPPTPSTATPMPPQPPVIAPGVQENAGKSYEELARSAAQSRYLRPPTQLPSIAGGGYDSESDGDGVGRVAVLSREQIKAGALAAVRRLSGSSTSSSSVLAPVADAGVVGGDDAELFGLD